MCFPKVLCETRGASTAFGIGQSNIFMNYEFPLRESLKTLEYLPKEVVVLLKHANCVAAARLFADGIVGGKLRRDAMHWANFKDSEIG